MEVRRAISEAYRCKQRPSLEFVETTSVSPPFSGGPLTCPFDVIIDDKNVGEAWLQQANVFLVPSGSHTVQLRRAWATFLRSRRITISLRPNDEVDLISATWALLVTGRPELHVATARDLARVRSGQRKRPLPQNLAS